MPTSYLLIVFDTAVPAVPSNAKRRYINKDTFETLKDEYIKSIHIAEEPYTIEHRKYFCLSNLEAHTLVMILDVHKDNDSNTKIADNDK